MPRIPIIEQTTGLSLSTPTTQAQGQQMVSPLGNAGQVAAAGFDALAAADVHTQNALWHKENADAVANLSKPMSDAQVYWQQQLTDAKTRTIDGGLLQQPDGTTVGFRAKIEGDFDTWSKTFLDGVQNPKAKQIAMEQVNSMRTRVLDNALTFEAAAGVANRSQKVEDSVVNWSSQAASAKTVEDVDQLVLSAKTFIANSGFDEATRNQKAADAVKRIVVAANQGAMERDPVAFRAAAIQRYGVDPAAPPKPAPIPAASPDSGSVFSQAVTFTLKAEGGLNKSDTNGTPSNFGINQAAHPEVDVTRLTKDQAAAIYKKDYWDFIGGDKLAEQNPALAMVAFDTAVLNKQKGREFLEKSGGDPAKYMDLREQFLQSLIDKNPDKYGPYKKAWDNRNAELRASINTGGGRGLVNPPSAVGSADTVDLPAPPPVPVNPQMAALVNKLPVENLPSFISAATSHANQQQALARNVLEQTMRDQTSQAMTTGKVGTPLTEAQFIGAYGPADGSRKFREEYQPMLALGAAVAQTFSMSDAQQDATLANMKPQPDAQGYEVAQKRYDVYAQAVNAVRQQRQKDPVGFAMQQKVGGVTALDMSSPEKMAQGMAARLPQAQAVAQLFNTPIQLLSNAEADAMRRGFQQMSGGQQGDYLMALNRKINDPRAFRALVQQVSPDSPETQVAAALLSNNDSAVVRTHWFKPDETVSARDTANWILMGRHLINPTSDDKKADGKERGWSMPKEADFLQEYNSQVGNAFAGNAQAYRDTYQAVRAYYAGKASFMGKADSQINPDRELIREAIKGVTGGVTDYGGGKVLMPWGMKESDFAPAADRAARAAFAANGIQGNQATPSAYKLMGAGNGQYYLLSGTEPLRNPASGDKVLIDILNNGAPQAASPAAMPPVAPSRVSTGKVTTSVMPAGKTK